MSQFYAENESHIPQCVDINSGFFTLVILLSKMSAISIHAYSTITYLGFLGQHDSNRIIYICGA